MTIAHAEGGHRKWFLFGKPPAEARYLVFGCHYMGTGAAATYGTWPRQMGEAVLCPLQPPGRENRLAEDPLGSVAEYAYEATNAVAEFVDKPYAIVGHCGAVTLATALVAEIHHRGLPPPERVIASSWGAPHVRYYGRLPTLDPHTLDVRSELEAVCMERLGHLLDPEMAEIAEETLLEDLLLQQTYPLGLAFQFPIPVDVLSWDQDKVVRPDEVWPGRWDECAPEVSHHQLSGSHYAFLDGAPELCHLIAARAANALFESD